VSRVLSSTTLPIDQTAVDVAMKNGIAAVRISTHRILIFERVNDNWTQTDALDNADYTGGIAVSGTRILVSAVGCAGFVFEKNATTQRWEVTGRISLEFLECDRAYAPDLNNSTAMFSGPGREVQVFSAEWDGARLDAG